jgi:hypothetical protein
MRVMLQNNALDLNVFGFEEVNVVLYSFDDYAIALEKVWGR